MIKDLAYFTNKSLIERFYNVRKDVFHMSGFLEAEVAIVG